MNTGTAGRTRFPRHRYARPLLGALVMMAGLLLGPGSGTATAAPMILCHRDSCYGKDPQAMGCSSDAITLDTVRTGREVTIELRGSQACGAYWTRYSNYFGFDGAVYTKSMSTPGMATRKELAAYRGETGWTGMVSTSQTVLGCYAYWIDATGAGWQTTCTRTV
ncbi:DUF2690 domain-containing protein [Streptomyces sp. NPDC056519]|uniref:DUF2690 domain-containing protein n=1 Tax=Streptomyces sp. NPDC056519 TaxID=3345849 RepID=UPI0036740AE3